MSELLKCSRDGCSPVLQTRGEMRPEDHHTQFARYGAVKNLADEHGVHVLSIDEYRRDAFEVENEPEFSDDVRVSCSKCGKASPWMRRDIEEYRRHGDGDNRRYTVKRDGNMPKLFAAWDGMVK